LKQGTQLGRQHFFPRRSGLQPFRRTTDF
jgi:hypothetical protein